MYFRRFQNLLMIIKLKSHDQKKNIITIILDRSGSKFAKDKKTIIIIFRLN